MIYSSGKTCRKFILKKNFNFQRRCWEVIVGRQLQSFIIQQRELTLNKHMHMYKNTRISKQTRHKNFCVERTDIDAAATSQMAFWRQPAINVYKVLCLITVPLCHFWWRKPGPSVGTGHHWPPDQSWPHIQCDHHYHIKVQTAGRLGLIWTVYKMTILTIDNDQECVYR
jgi:hypothetical protein